MLTMLGPPVVGEIIPVGVLLGTLQINGLSSGIRGIVSGAAGSIVGDVGVSPAGIGGITSMGDSLSHTMRTMVFRIMAVTHWVE